MAALRRILADVASAEGLVLLEASDPYNVFDLLVNRPEGGCVVTLWEGDQPQAQAHRALVVTHEVSVSVTKPMHPRARAAGRSDAETTGSAPLLSLVAAVRSRILDAEVEGVASAFTYGGCAPLVAPNGIPLDGYRLTFRLRASARVDRPEGVPLPM